MSPSPVPSPPSASAPPRPIRQAATLVVLRDGAQGLEVLLLRRAEKANDQNSGASVFPGGLLDAHDRGLHDFCCGIDDAWASTRLGLPAGGLDYFAAAVRECFEEAGLLFAQDARQQLLDLGGLSQGELAAMRAAAAAGTDALLAMCRERGWQLAVDRLAYFAHWLTPPGMPRRFDTRFFIAAVPPGQEVEVDRFEIAEHGWLRPHDALDPARRLKLMNVTRRILQQLAQFASVDECLAHAGGLREVVLNMPRLAGGPGGARAVNIEEPAYAEIGYVDPDGRGHAFHTLAGGVMLALSPNVWRVTSSLADASPGAHSYFIGSGADGHWALVDPHVGDDAHVQAFRAAAPGPVRWILSTNRHEAVVGSASTWRAIWPGAAFAPAEPGADVRVGELRLRVLVPDSDASARGFLLTPGGMLIAGAAAWMPSDLPREAEWLAPAHGFLQRAR